MGRTVTDQDLRLPGIYCIKNIVSGRIYVGSAKDIHDRWRLHRKELRLGIHHSSVFQRSWNKHGPEAFQITILESVDKFENLITREQIWIDRLNAACPKTGLNRSPKAGSTLGLKYKRSEQSLIVIRQILIERNKSPEHRRKVSQSKMGVPKSPSAKQKIREKLLGRKLPPRSATHQRRVNAAHAKRKRLGGTQISFPFIQRIRNVRSAPKSKQ